MFTYNPRANVSGGCGKNGHLARKQDTDVCTSLTCQRFFRKQLAAGQCYVCACNEKYIFLTRSVLAPAYLRVQGKRMQYY